MNFWSSAVAGPVFSPPLTAAAAPAGPPTPSRGGLRQRRGTQWLTLLYRQRAAAAAAATATTSPAAIELARPPPVLTPRMRAIRFARTPALRDAFLAVEPRSPLYAHQEQAVAFMAACEAGGGGGGILADEMRMGKTLTVFAFVLRDLQARVRAGEDRFGRPTLIVMPKTLLRVWQQELAKHLGAGDAAPLACATLTAAAAEEQSVLRLIGTTDLVLCTYPSLQHPRVAAVLGAVAWRRLVADEAHVFASARGGGGGSGGKPSQCLQRLQRLRADARWFLSATPVQNSARDLGVALHFVGVPADVAFGPPTAPAFQAAVQRVLLRRRWADVHAGAQALTASAHVVWLDFDSLAEATLYNATMRAAREHLASGGGGGGGADSNYAVRIVTQLRQLCLNPLLVGDLVLPAGMRTAPADAGDAAMHTLWRQRALRGAEAVGALAAAAGVELGALAAASDAGAFDALLPPVFTKERWVLDYVRTRVAPFAGAADGRGKAVVYSTYKHVLERVRALLEERAPGTTRLVDGSQSADERYAHLDAFERDAAVQVLLITKGTGRHGLALTCAAHVVLMDAWWNPTVDDQAVARIFDGRRPERRLAIATLAMRDTIDAYVVHVADTKRALDALLPVERAIQLYYNNTAAAAAATPGGEHGFYSQALAFIAGRLHE